MQLLQKGSFSTALGSQKGVNLAKGNIMTHWKINISMYGTTLYIFYSKFSTDMLCVDNFLYFR